jgi:hypothetical protein
MENIIKGDTLELTYGPGDYAIADYDIEIALRGASKIDIKTGETGVTIATTSGDYEVTVTSAVTANWTAGNYEFAVYLVKTGERHIIQSGKVEIEDNVSGISAAYDPRSTVKKTLDAIEAVLEGRASQDIMSYQIAGRQIAKIPVPDLLKMRDYFKREYASEQKAEALANGIGTGGKILVRF